MTDKHPFSEANVQLYLSEQIPTEFQAALVKREELRGELERWDGYLIWLQRVSETAGIPLGEGP